MKKILCFLLTLIPAYSIVAQQVLQLDISTGVLNGTNINNIPPSALADGNNDDTWQCSGTQSSLQSYQSAKVASPLGSYATPPAGIKWISPKLTASNKPANITSMYYLYRMSFTVPMCTQIQSATITLNHLGADNLVDGIAVSNLSNYQLNGNFHSVSQGVSPLGQGITINLSPGEVVPGANYIYVKTLNTYNASQGAPSALLMNGNIKINYTQLSIPAPPAAYFTTNNIYCEGDPVVLNGTGSSGVITSHYWLIQEYDSLNSPLANWYWVSPSVAAAPGMYTVPQGGSVPAMKCGKYYEISLFVNNCSIGHYNGHSKFIYITCKPPISFQGSSSSICLGGTGAISVSMAGNLNPNNYTLTVVDLSVAGPPATVIYSGTPNTSISVSPIATTTYQVTVTDNTTGCSNVQNWTVQVNTQSTPIYLNGSTPSICKGSSGGISVSIPAHLNAMNYGLSITEMSSNTNVYTGIPNVSISLSPTVNTQYEITLVDYLTGCISKAYWTIQVVNGSLPVDLTGSATHVCASVGQGGLVVSLPLNYNPADYTVNIFDGSNTLVYSGAVNVAVMLSLSSTSTFTIQVIDIYSGCITTVYWTMTLVGCKTNGQFSTGTAPDPKHINDIFVYPNPGKDLFHIKTTLHGQAGLELYDIMGRLVYQSTAEELSVENTLSLNGLGKGIYLLQVNTAADVYYKKLIIE